IQEDFHRRIPYRKANRVQLRLQKHSVYSQLLKFATLSPFAYIDINMREAKGCFNRERIGKVPAPWIRVRNAPVIATGRHSERLACQITVTGRLPPAT